MPFTSAVMMALPSDGLPPHVHVIVCCTACSCASSSMVALKAFSTSPETERRHCRGLSTARSFVALHSALVAVRNTSLMTEFGVMVVWSHANCPSEASAATYPPAVSADCAALSLASWPAAPAASSAVAAKAGVAPTSSKEVAATALTAICFLSAIVVASAISH